SGLTTKIRNIDGKIIGKDSTQRKEIRCVQADPVLDVNANAVMEKDYVEGPPLKSILKRPNVASNMAVVNATTEVPVKDLQHDVNSGPDSSNSKASPPMEDLHSDVNINMENVDNLANNPKPVMGINVALVLVSEVIRGSTSLGDYSATNAVKQYNSSASDVPKSTVTVTDGASKTAPMSFANIIKSQHVKKGNFCSLLNANKVESFDFVLPKYAVDEVKSSSKVERITEATNGNSLIECEGDIIIPCRLATVASGAASGVQTTTYMSDNIPSVTGNHHIFHQPPNASNFCGRQISTLSLLEFGSQSIECDHLNEIEMVVNCKTLEKCVNMLVKVGHGVVVTHEVSMTVSLLWIVDSERDRLIFVDRGTRFVPLFVDRGTRSVPLFVMLSVTVSTWFDVIAC
ncbi:hypothetical protein Tco_1009498, partial [Tanacetum coccineum]